MYTHTLAYNYNNVEINELLELHHGAMLSIHCDIPYMGKFWWGKNW